MALKASNLVKYLTRYAEPEAALLVPHGKRYDFAVVVPACGESVEFMTGWQAFVRGLPPSARVLFVLVVNSDSSTRAEYLAANDALLDHFRSGRHQSVQGACPTLLAERESHDVLVFDRHSSPYRLPPKTGVGLARKLGGDVVCGWFAQGALTSAWWLSTDADVVLPAALWQCWQMLPRQPGVGCLPFEHVAGGEHGVDLATLAVEVKLRYHVLGLRYAGSAYAWPALGSCLALHIELYASVRGFPKRMAGEDFYMLEKASKLGPVFQLEGAPIRIVARRSVRTPFGTGQGVSELLTAGEPELAFRLRSPACYRWLKELLQQTSQSVEQGDASFLQNWLSDLKEMPDLVNAITSTGLVEAVSRTCATAQAARVRQARVAEWFDGLKQVQFLKALEHCLAPLPYRDALARAPFVPDGASVSSISHAVEQLRKL